MRWWTAGFVGLGCLMLSAAPLHAQTAQQQQDTSKEQTKAPEPKAPEPKPEQAGQAAHELTQNQNRVATRLRDQIKRQLKLTKAQTATLTTAVREYVYSKGDPDVLRVMARNSVHNHCINLCTVRLVQMVNRAMERGASDKQARNLAMQSLRERIRERDRQHLKWTTDELAKRVQSRFEFKLQRWERLRERTRQRATEEMPQPAPRGQ